MLFRSKIGGTNAGLHICWDTGAEMLDGFTGATDRDANGIKGA